MTKNQPVGTIMNDTDLKLMLLRHWSLFESLNNSNYIVTKLTTWKEPGQKELRRLLATIGVPIEEAK